MATPTSSATSASPPMAYLHPGAIVPASNPSETDAAELESRKRAVQKFLARAEISMVTRGLRTRLSYASYKAIHNISHVSLRDLEARSASQAVSTRTSGTKRKIGGNNSYSNNPASQGNNSNVSPGATVSAQRRGAMPPPSFSASASRSPHANSNNAASMTSRSPNASQSLYASILAPPPSKLARTIHNAGDLPLSGSARAVAISPKPKKGRTSDASGARRNAATSARSQAKGRKDDKDHRKDKRPDKGKERKKFSQTSVLAGGEEADIKAAATLTSLLLHSRPSVTASPRSSKSAGSDAGSVQSYPPFAHGSTRGVATAVPSADSSFMIPGNRTMTPPPGVAGLFGTPAHTTPKASGSLKENFGDSEAADLMLFLATSPSPARPTSTRGKDARDSAAFRTLGGGAGVRAKGRVLFPDTVEPGSRGSALSRSAEDSFASSISSIGGQVGDACRDAGISDVTGGISHGPADEASVLQPAEAPATPSNLTSSHLLPPIQPSLSTHDSSSGSWTQPASYMSADPKSSLQEPPTPTNLTFNFNDFINVSPSPAVAERTSQHKGNLREEVGRRLFEEEQQRQTPVGESGPTGSGGSVGLGAGIDLVQN